jgi:hypothetical protein
MSLTILYCPRCAKPMGRVGGLITCEPGRMPISPPLEEALLPRFGPHVRAEAPEPPPASFYCPACRVPLDDKYACPSCRGSIADLIFIVVDLHPHFPYY